ncbi:hypothetical protein BZARG_956 [Bizionia argentinensis JUB59]|uniref:Carboxypeptidase-like regulatory domain-containing protein n=1 Tax=Bizionia argentinensis JUB59 TaxID=1046627 RepID=G2EBS7_9FLAO|nr:hypothetical protein [Bizionia argentinensis]EGV44104.1 hypothetical protein BZARG_956 [Bizionia argentinensis JUB59]
MKQQLLGFLFVLSFGTIFSQNTTRIEVEGKIIASSDVEGVTIFNKSSKKGTVATADGDFTMAVALYDVLEISALQYEPRTVVINQDVMDSKKLRLFLVESVTTLTEVILLPSKLTGDLLTDIENAEVQKEIFMSFGNLSNLEFPEDAFTKPINSVTNQGDFYNGINFASILGVNKWVNSPLKKRSIEMARENRPLDLGDIYSPKYINETYNIPLNKVEAFFAFITENGFKASLLGEKNELKRMEFLKKQSDLFLKLENGQN